MRIIFFGTANISKYFLENIDSKHEIVSVVTMCDKPVGRSNKIKPPAVKEYAIEKNIPYIQVDKFNDEIAQQIKDYNADVGVVVSFGKIIPEKVFTAPKYGCFNIHFSLLPKYRGASPVQQALIDGCTKTGVTAFYIEKGLDTGNILLQKELDIDLKDTSETLFDKLNILGVKVMNDALALLDSGNCLAKKQEGEPSFCSVFTKENGKIDWNKSATEIYNLYRGLYLWPRIFCSIGDGRMSGKTMKILECSIAKDLSNKQPGTILEIKKGLGFTVKCGKDSLFVTKVQPESKAQMSAFDFVNGAQIKVGSLLL
ncbi:methionyl-tRNA formyltransferase [Candidatus Ruminimicrobiellum ovillum]|uniref:methionyl-tRNA formyltransferase n=1 Tax=Candidatus Ruminimicrobiellum ovillum TaxID=1947927 RepID=UPI00355A31B4